MDAEQMVHIRVAGRDQRLGRGTGIDNVNRWRFFELVEVARIEWATKIAGMVAIRMRRRSQSITIAVT